MIVLGWLLAILALAGIGWWLLGAFASASPRSVVSALKLFMASFAAMASLGLLALGRLGIVLAFFGALGLTVTRLRAKSRPPDPLDGEAPGSAGESSIETGWLSMQLDRASGAMSGRVKTGRFAGRTLDSLDIGEVLALREELSASEPASLPLIDTWLDRMAPGWRAQAGGSRGSDATNTTEEMNETMALDILGLGPGVGRAEVEAAYRRVMAQVHPDKGGSDRLASLVNAAREFLLNRI